VHALLTQIVPLIKALYLLAVNRRALCCLTDYKGVAALTDQIYQVLSRHLSDAHHPDCVWGDRLVVEGCVHEGTGAGGRCLVVFGRHRIMSLHEGL